MSKHSSRSFRDRAQIFRLFMTHIPLLQLTHKAAVVFYVFMFSFAMAFERISLFHLCLLDRSDLPLIRQGEAISFKTALTLCCWMELPLMEVLHCHCPPPGRLLPDFQFKLTSKLQASESCTLNHLPYPKGRILCLVQETPILYGQQVKYELIVIEQQQILARMLKDNPNQGLLGPDKSDLNKSSLQDNKEPPVSKSKLDERQDNLSKPPKKKERSEVTYILKVLNLVVGLIYLGFAVFFYSNGNQEENLQNRGFMLRWLMPAYIGVSGLIIVLIQCRIGFMVRNLSFFYNYFGRGLFNLYAGGMPLMFINDWSGNMTALDIISLVASAVMCLVGLLYIGLKCCCCEKEGQKIDRLNREEDSD